MKSECVVVEPESSKDASVTIEVRPDKIRKAKPEKPEWPKTIKSGSVFVKIYKVRNKSYSGADKNKQKERFSFTVSHFASGKRSMKMFADYGEAYAYAKSVGDSLARGELEVLELRSGDRLAYVHAVEALKPTGMALELAARGYAEAWKALGERRPWWRRRGSLQDGICMNCRIRCCRTR